MNIRIGGGTHTPNFTEPVSCWVPTSIALAGTELWRVRLSGNGEIGRERLFANLGERIRDVRQGRDGLLYLLTDSGRMMRVSD